MGKGIEARHVGDFGHVVLAFLQEVGRAVELVALEEYAGVLAGETLTL